MNDDQPQLPADTETHPVDVAAGVTATPVRDVAFPPAWTPDAPRLDDDRLPTDPGLRRAALRDRVRSQETTPDGATDETERYVPLGGALPDGTELYVRLGDVPRLTALHPLGRTAWFRSRTGRWTAPAIITATADSLYPPNVEAGHVPDLTSPDHVHLTVLTPGIQGHVSDETRETHPELTDPDRPNRPAGGTFQEWDVVRWDPEPEDVTDSEGAPTFDFTVQPPGTWMWPR